jgi:hypothetical protein
MCTAEELKVLRPPPPAGEGEPEPEPDQVARNAIVRNVLNLVQER